MADATFTPMTDSALAPAPRAKAAPFRRATEEPRWFRWTLTAVVLLLLAVLVLAPLATVFVEALAEGAAMAIESLGDEDALAAIRLTVTIAAVAVPLNALFGVAAAWVLTKYSWRGKALLLTLVDLPFSVSPVVAGLCIVLLFGANAGLGGWLVASGYPIVFAVPGIILATMFITFPFVARELVPLMTEQGKSEEEAALTLGASGWRMFFTVTLPNIRWALLYGVLLCNARAMGEFGAVAVVSGKIRGETATMPIMIEIFYNQYASVAAFAMAAVLTLLALVTLCLKSALEWRYADQLAASGRH